jgi:hypothetical protein
VIIGSFLNALGILLGALLGLARRQPLTARTQDFFKAALGILTAFYGLRLIYQNVEWRLAVCWKQLALAVLAVVIGNWVGRLLRLQTWSNRLGRHAATLLASTLLFCAAPLGFLGAVVDGLEGYWYLLELKAVMDGLAMMSFVKVFRWPAAFAALPVFLFFNGIGLAVQLGVRPWLEPLQLTNSIGAAAGLDTCIVALVIFQVRRVELANYLPALVVAPILTHWLE